MRFENIYYSLRDWNVEDLRDSIKWAGKNVAICYRTSFLAADFFAFIKAFVIQVFLVTLIHKKIV
jgi:hypothetical protein